MTNLDGLKYPCNQCGFKATQKYGLKEHERSVHEGVKYPCDHCSYKATNQRNLIKHKRGIHEGGCPSM